MRHLLARILLPLSALVFAAGSVLMFKRVEPFTTHFYFFAWWPFILALDSWLFLKEEELSLFLRKPVDFLTFLVPLSAVCWFIFEAFNLRLMNWSYSGLPANIAVRWTGYCLAFGTVLPGIFLGANLLERLGVSRRNDFSSFFPDPLPSSISVLLVSSGALMLLAPLLLPTLFYPLVWGGFVLLLDPVNERMGGRSLIQEWRQKNWNRTVQLMLSGLLCGLLWEAWNYKAGAKWNYSVPLPEFLQVKLFEMPLPGYLGFLPFALECFVMAESARLIREKVPPNVWKALVVMGAAFCLLLCRGIDIFTVESFR